MTACVGHHDQPEPADVGYLCFACYSRLRSSLLELPAIATWLAVNVTRGGTATERVSGTREDPIPLRTDVLDLIGPDSRRRVPGPMPSVLLWEDGVVVGVFDTWREAVHARWAEILDNDSLDVDVRRWQVRVTERGGCDQAGEDTIRATVNYWAHLIHEEAEGQFAWTDRNDVVGLVEWIAGHLSWVAERAWVDDLITDVERLSKAAHRVAPWRAELLRDRQEACTRCGVLALVQHVAEGRVTCERRFGGCGWSRPVTDYEFTSRHLRGRTA